MKRAEEDADVRVSTETTEDVDKYSSARELYRPNQIEWLLIAESPPTSGGYFYFRWTIGKDHLFRETMKALNIWPESQVMNKGLDKSPYLDRFRREKFFLIDTCELPVDKLPPKSRLLQIAKGASAIASRVRELDPVKIIIVKTTVYAPVRSALHSAGLQDRILNMGPIPFPSHGHQARYRREIRRLTRPN